MLIDDNFRAVKILSLEIIRVSQDISVHPSRLSKLHDGLSFVFSLTVPEQISSLLPVASVFPTEHKVVKVTAVISRDRPRPGITGPSLRTFPSSHSQLYGQCHIENPEGCPEGGKD